MNKIQKIALNLVKANENNPRTISKEKFTKLVNSILTFPEMMELRPVVVDSEYVALGGNMRTLALAEIESMSMEDIQERLKVKEDVLDSNLSYDRLVDYWKAWKKKPFAYTIDASSLTEDQKREFIIKDNVAFGQWDWDELANSWDSNLLNDWGLDVWDNNEEKINLDNLFEPELQKEDKKSNEIVIEVAIPIEEEDTKSDVEEIIKDALKDYPNISVR